MTPVIHYKDADFLVAEKPAGIPTQPLRVGAPLGAPQLEGAASSAPTLAEILAETYPELKSVGGADCGAVHRLDIDTSGLVIFARNQKTYDYFREVFSKNLIEREYLALVEGVVSESGKIDWPIGPDPKSAKKVKVYKNIKEARRNKAQEAVTSFEVIPSGASLGTPHSKGAASSAPTTLLRVKIKTGRRHQIRAHLAAIGHPVLKLHASRLTFDPPPRLRSSGPLEVQSLPSFAE